MNEDKITVVAPGADGEPVEYDVLFTFDSEDTDKSYVGYSDHSVADNGRVNIYVSSYDPVLGMGSLEDITDKDELEMIHDVLLEIDKQSK